MKKKLTPLLMIGTGLVLGFLAANSNPFNNAEARHTNQASRPVHMPAVTLPGPSQESGSNSEHAHKLLVATNEEELALAKAKVQRRTGKKPNILVIWGDDIGQFNVSAYNMGIMGYKTPNIDRIAKQGAIFTDWYGQQSCTAGRAAFITGQSPMRTGLTKVGLPGAPEGMQIEDPTIAGLLKSRGYVTAQFGKNHLGDRN